MDNIVIENKIEVLMGYYKFSTKLAEALGVHQISILKQ